MHDMYTTRWKHEGWFCSQILEYLNDKAIELNFEAI